MLNQCPSGLATRQLARELHKPVVKKIGKWKVYSCFKDNAWGVGYANMQLISKFNKRFYFLLCIIDIYNKCAWVVPLKYEKGIRITNASQ